MVKSTIYKGIEFVRLSSLSNAEQELFMKTQGRQGIIKILINEEIVNDCIQYKDYLKLHAVQMVEGKPSKIVIQTVAEPQEEFHLESR